MARINHANSTMTVTNAAGVSAKRKTGNYYRAAIVGTRKADGKLVIVYAGWSEGAVRAALQKQHAGAFVNHKFTGVTDFEIVVADAADLAVIAALGAANMEIARAYREQAEIDADAALWEPCPIDPTGEKADAILLAARRAR